MSIHMTDSRIYGGSWGTDEIREIFEEETRTKAWCRLIGTLADAQAEVGIIPGAAAEEIRRVCDNPDLPMDELRAGYERTGHSMLGLIEILEEQCEDDAGEWLYYGATVQDITDTWFMQCLNQVRSIVQRDCRTILETLLDFVEEHRETVVLGRTHGQAGSPITFGYKAAVWAREIGRHLDRLEDLEDRVSVGQLGGAVGGLTAYGEDGDQLREAFFERLDLAAPEIAWINSRDRLVEFFQTLSLITSTLDKIGHEVYNLQRTELGEVEEHLSSKSVGSITMPHKKNPELSEHLGTLSRLARSGTQTLSESLVHDHERDGRSWKVEWEVIPSVCVATGAALEHGKNLLDGLQVNKDTMRENLDALEGFPHSERLMLRLAGEIGKQSAHTIVHELAREAQSTETSFEVAVREDDRIRNHLDEATLESIFSGGGGLEQVQAAIDRVLEAHGRL